MTPKPNLTAEETGLVYPAAKLGVKEWRASLADASASALARLRDALSR
jgi:hypothetical protein